MPKNRLRDTQELIFTALHAEDCIGKNIYLFNTAEATNGFHFQLLALFVAMPTKRTASQQLWFTDHRHGLWLILGKTGHHLSASLSEMYLYIPCKILRPGGHQRRQAEGKDRRERLRPKGSFYNEVGKGCRRL